jgi:hypothetical protein
MNSISSLGIRASHYLKRGHLHMNTSPNAPVRERGGCLTAYLVVAVLGAVASLVLLLGAGSLNASLAAQGVDTTLPGWVIPAQIVLVIIAVAGVYGIWTWKKWGVYLLVAEWVLSTLIGVASGSGASSGAASLVLGGAVLYYLLKDKWAQFE